MPRKIVVTGATGQLGSDVLVHLCKLVSKDIVVGTARDPSKFTSPEGIEIRPGDFSDPSSLTAAFQDASELLIVSVNKLGEEAMAMHREAIKAAGEMGVKKVWYTSHSGARLDSTFPPAVTHATTEEYLVQSGIPFTSLRHGFYVESLIQMLGPDLLHGEIRAPQDGPVAWTARSDLAEADASLLSRPQVASASQWEGPSPPLTASEALTLDHVAALATRVSGREVRRIVVPDDEWVEEKVDKGTPRMVVEMYLGMWKAARSGDFAMTDPALRELLGREPKTMSEVLEELYQKA